MDWTEEVEEFDTPDSLETPGRHRPRLLVYSVVALLIVASIGALGFVFGHYVVKAPASALQLPSNGGSILPSNGGSNFPGDGFGNEPRTGPTPSPATVTPKVSAATAKIAKKVDPGLVDITTNLSYQSTTAEGTGIILSKNGLVLTNNHVIEGATSISARDVATGSTYKATVVGYDATNDVALLQLQNASGLTKVTLGNSSSVTTGQPVVGIGNAGGVGGTPSVATGSVTALNQSITASSQGSPSGAEQLSGLIQVSAPVEPGDSGGPLVNAKGKVIGMDTAGSASSGFGSDFGQSAANQAQAYAIPINTALAIVKSIEKGQGSSTIHIGSTGFLGIEIGPSFTSPSGSVSPSTTSGVSVQATIPGTPAASSPLAAGDMITSLDGHAVSSATALAGLVASLHPGDTVRIGYVNLNGVAATLSLKLASGPPL